MRTIIFFYVITFSSWIYSQKLTPENYYDFYKTINEVKGDKLTTEWLNKKEAAEILVEEMEKAGFEWVNDFRIVKLEQNDYIIDNDRDNDYVVTKKDMLEIFRNDVRNHILNFKK